MGFRFRHGAAVASVALAAFVAAGCEVGGSGGPSGGGGELAAEAKGAKFVPQDALMYFTVNTDFDGDAWDDFDSLAGQFPGWEDARAEMIDEINSSEEDITYEDDIEPWLGDEAGVAVLSFDVSAASEDVPIGGDATVVEMEADATTMEGGDGDAGADGMEEGDTGEEMEEGSDDSDTTSSGDEADFMLWVESTDDEAAAEFLEKNFTEQGTSEHEGWEIVEAESNDEAGDTLWYTLSDGIVLLANSEEVLTTAIDTEDGGDDITGVDGFERALDPVSEGALVVGYVAGDAMRELVESSAEESGEDLGGFTEHELYEGFEGMSFAFGAEDEGFRLEDHVAFSDDVDEEALGEASDPALLEGMPSGVIAAMSVHDLGRSIEQGLDYLEGMEEAASQLDAMEASLNISLEDIAAVTHGETAIGISGGGVPTGGLVFEAEDEEQAGEVVTGVIEAAAGAQGAPAETVDVDGTETTQASVEGQTVIGAVVDGLGIIATSEAFFTSIKEGDEPLGDNETYGDATEAAGMPDEVVAAAYLDTQAALELAGFFVPAAQDENTEPLGPVVAFAMLDDRVYSGHVFVNIEGE